VYQVWTRGDINGRRYWDGNEWTSGLSYLTLQIFAHSIVVHMTSIDNSCSTFVDLILESMVTITPILVRMNDDRNSGSDPSNLIIDSLLIR